MQTDSTYQNLLSYARNYANNNIITACAIGENCLAVQSSLGCGLAFVERDFWRIMPAQAELRRTEQSLCGMQLDELIPKYLEQDPLQSALAFAAINSIFSQFGQFSGEFAFTTELKRHKRLGMVGCFHPLMPFVRGSGIELVLFELQEMPGAHAPKEAPELLPSCDMLIITASTFVNHTLHLYTPYISPLADVYIMGPSTPLSPELAAHWNLGGSLIETGAEEAAFEKIRQGYSYRKLSPWLRKVMLPCRK